MSIDVPAYEDSFEWLDPKDGFHVLRVDTANLITLAAVLYVNGEETGRVNVLSYHAPEQSASGHVNRLHLCLEAIARYLRTGGSTAELGQALQRFQSINPGAIEFPGYYLKDSYSTRDGSWQHIFVHIGTDDAVLWEEPSYAESGNSLVGGFIDFTDLETIDQEQIDDGIEWQEKEKGEAAAG